MKTDDWYRQQAREQCEGADDIDFDVVPTVSQSEGGAYVSAWVWVNDPDDGAGEVELRFRNYYRHCGEDWSDTWDSMCNDRCPNCDAEVEPYQSDELETGETITYEK